MKLFAEPDEKIRFDVYLANETDYTRSYIKQLIEMRKITLIKQALLLGHIVLKRI